MAAVAAEIFAAPGAGAAASLDDLMPSEDDLLYEEELLRNPYSLKMWWRYLQARADASEHRRHLLFERALKALPGSYKVSNARLSNAHPCCQHSSAGSRHQHRLVW